MTTEEKQTLDRLLALYFAEADLNDRNFVFRNSTAQLLKKHLSKQGRWKARGRGKPQPKVALLARLRRK